MKVDHEYKNSFTYSLLRVCGIYREAKSTPSRCAGRFSAIVSYLWAIGFCCLCLGTSCGLLVGDMSDQFCFLGTLAVCFISLVFSICLVGGLLMKRIGLLSIYLISCLVFKVFCYLLLVISILAVVVVSYVAVLEEKNRVAPSQRYSNNNGFKEFQILGPLIAWTFLMFINIVNLLIKPVAITMAVMSEREDSSRKPSMSDQLEYDIDYNSPTPSNSTPGRLYPSLV